jgi:hypothetical protein
MALSLWRDNVAVIGNAQEYLDIAETLRVELNKLCGILEKIDADWPYYESNLGDRYCYYCDHLLAAGPHSPFPHNDDCVITAIRNIMEPEGEVA